MVRRCVFIVLLLFLASRSLAASPVQTIGLNGLAWLIQPTVNQYADVSFGDFSTLSIPNFGGIFSIKSNGDGIDVSFLRDTVIDTVTVLQFDFYNATKQLYPLLAGVPTAGWGSGRSGDNFDVSVSFTPPGTASAFGEGVYHAGDTVSITLSDAAPSPNPLPEPASASSLLLFGLVLVICNRYRRTSQ